MSEPGDSVRAMITEEWAAYEGRLETTERRKHAQDARTELHAIAMRLHEELIRWERHFDMGVSGVNLRREIRLGSRRTELVNVEIEAGL